MCSWPHASVVTVRRKTRVSQIWVWQRSYVQHVAGPLPLWWTAFLLSFVSEPVRCMMICDIMSSWSVVWCEHENINKQARGLLSVSVLNRKQPPAYPPEGEWQSIKALINASPFHWGSSINEWEHKTLPVSAETKTPIISAEELIGCFFFNRKFLNHTLWKPDIFWLFKFG